MKNLKKYNAFILIISLSFLFIKCTDENANGNVIEQISCADGIQNGDETGIDCGGTACEPCIDGGLSFTGTYLQEDSIGKPGVNLLLGGNPTDKNNYNTTLPSDRTDFQNIFENTIEAYYDMYAESLGFTPEELNYEPNILGQDVLVFSSFLANSDVLQVAPDGETTFYDVNTTTLFTGRNPQDDVMDFMLKLCFGGTSGNRFDGTNSTPILITDNVDAGDRAIVTTFPYFEPPLVQ